VKDTEHSAEYRNQAMDSLQERLKNMDAALEQERENSRKIEVNIFCVKISCKKMFYFCRKI
jgi:hypothetical protein